MFDLFRNSAGAIAAFLVLAVISSLISANVRTAATKRRWDTILDTFIDQVAAIPVIGRLVSSARAMIAGWGPLQRRWWLWLALGLSGGIAISLWAVSFSPSRGGGDELPKATASLERQITQLQAALENVTRQRDDALRLTGLPPAPPPPNLSAEDIKTMIGVWKSVEQQMNDLSALLDEGDAMLETWAVETEANRSAEIKKAQDFSAKASNFRINKLKSINDFLA